MERRHYVVLLLGFLAIWAVVLISEGDYSPAGIANAGGALAPLGSIVTALALLFAFQQNRETANRAHRDKLAEAYAVWFTTARGLFEEMDRGLGQSRLHAQNRKLMEARNAALAETPKLAKIRIAATPVLLLEEREDLRTTIESLWSMLPTTPWMTATAVAAATNLHVAILDRRRVLEQLFADVAVRLRSGNRPEPVAVEETPQNTPETEATPEPNP